VVGVLAQAPGTLFLGTSSAGEFLLAWGGPRCVALRCSLRPLGSVHCFHMSEHGKWCLDLSSFLLVWHNRWYNACWQCSGATLPELVKGVDSNLL